MRLRDISEQVRELMEVHPEVLMGDSVAHALVQNIQDVQTLYRPTSVGGRRSALGPWLTFAFEPFNGLIEPFNIYPGRYWAMLRMHKQPSGLPELLTHIARDLPSAATHVEPDFFLSFSNSPNVDTIIRRVGKEPASLRFFHKGNLPLPDGTALPAEYCLPGISEALPEGYPDDGIPGPITPEGGETSLYLGELIFYNQFRTADRAKLRNLLLNCVAVATVARYVREHVRKAGVVSAAG